MQLALDTVTKTQGGVCVVDSRQGRRHGAAADRRPPFRQARHRGRRRRRGRSRRRGTEAGCNIPYMGFNLIPLSVIPEIRITDKGLVLVPEMKLAPLYEEVA